MKKINFFTLFPNYYNPFISESIIAKAIQKNLIEINVIDWRNFVETKQKKVDDEIYGGGKGMLLQLEPIVKGLRSLKTKENFIVLVSPQGKIFTQQMVQEWVDKHQQITFISGRYEGFDERLLNYVDEEISIGDFVLTGGELPSMVMADAYIRLIPDVIKQESSEYESFNNHLLDYEQYTRPRDFEGHLVPEVYISGNHQKIEQARLESQIAKTKKNRPDLYLKYERLKNEK
ncbi:tRNA (guanosine(37)-N1)-methyltransferase TrmD [Mycoplasmopsis agassizii]|uniref:tRNA (guanine-N(1)-)-methyltransferase n=1 Tax=Mycoplasmopsis agassizii TaxID=33922 RepID=A0A269TJS6_9BACT|nr:tRNA (guanosine(37)-N1)-methyltransferase TrmD [Mycoplasmopsis agassizii]PAK21637.1 tRNA (guanosine(37)-N1)-methyltransferase TrmD [Mycoplasmopsis agassizii]